MMKKTTKNIFFTKALLGFLLVLVISLSSCNLNIKKSVDGTSDETDQDEFVTESVDVHFSIYLPSPPEENENIALEILDEVTGLPYNSRLYQMQKTSSQVFSLDLSIPTGSVVKYRFVKVGTTITPEVITGGEQVRYRLLLIDGETEVVDILQGWQGANLSDDTGSLSGKVVDDSTQQPLADILISVGGHLSFTDANGQYAINGITPGVHNVVFYAMDGQYQTFQQGATVVSGVNTSANVQMTARSLVQITFRVTTPNDALGIPVYLAGNLLQLGNTFSDLSGGMSIKPKQMRILSQQEDGTFLLTLDLYAGTDLRYKFTLGDGYWNAERTDIGDFKLRQLIVPDHSVTLDLTVTSWRTQGVEPVTFNITIPSENNPGDEKYIQLKAGYWTEPIPLWPLGGGNYLFIVFSPLDVSTLISYRFCRNENWDQALDAESLLSESSVQPMENAQSVEVTLTDWQNWEQVSHPTEVIAANIPEKDESYQTWIELTPEMTPTWQIYAPIGISSLPEIGVSTVVVSPQWFISADNTTLSPVIGETPFESNLTVLMESITTMGMDTGLFPRIGSTGSIKEFWSYQGHSDTWWQDWFTSYRQYILNYAQIAAVTKAEWFVIGGKDVMAAFPGGTFSDGSTSDVPEGFDDLWLQLISEIRSIYTGKLVWAANAQVSLDPLPNFIDMVDAIYITIDSPIAYSSNPSAEELAYNFEEIVNTQVYQVYENTQKQIIAALAYPSVENAASGCTLIDSDCSNDGIFLAEEVGDYAVDLDAQVSIYNTAFPVLANRDWINGIAIRGYDPTIVMLDGSSSVAGKPALDVIWYWFSGLSPE